MKHGGEHWQWSPETPFHIGVIPRYGAKTSDVKVSELSLQIWSVSLLSHTLLAHAVVHIQELIPWAYGQCL